MRVWLLRHGATAYNDERRYQGRLDGPLSPRGLAALKRAELDPEVVYVSPLRRAGQTAAVLFPEAKQIEIPDFREMDFGAFEGRSARELADEPAYRAWVKGGCAGPPPGGESRADFSRRVCGAFASLVEAALDAGDPRLVILAHGGTQMAALERYALPRRDYFDWRGPLAGGFVLETDASAWKARRALRLLKTVRYAKEPI